MVRVKFNSGVSLRCAVSQEKLYYISSGEESDPENLIALRKVYACIFNERRGLLRLSMRSSANTWNWRHCRLDSATGLDYLLSLDHGVSLL